MDYKKNNNTSAGSLSLHTDGKGIIKTTVLTAKIFSIVLCQESKTNLFGQKKSWNNKDVNQNAACVVIIHHCCKVWMESFAQVYYPNSCVPGLCRDVVQITSLACFRVCQRNIFFLLVMM